MKIWTLHSPQNDHLNLSLVKDVKLVGEKKTIRNGRETYFCQSQILVISLDVYESHSIYSSNKEKENDFHQLYQIGLLVLRSTAILI